VSCQVEPLCFQELTPETHYVLSNSGPWFGKLHLAQSREVTVRFVHILRLAAETLTTSFDHLHRVLTGRLSSALDAVHHFPSENRHMTTTFMLRRIASNPMTHSPIN